MTIEFTLPTQDTAHTLTIDDPQIAAMLRQFQLEQLVHHLFEAARAGATLTELTTAAREALGDESPAHAASVASRVFETHRINEQRATTTRALIADALAGYPANGWLAAVIVDAAPFATRPSIWTKEA